MLFEWYWFLLYYFIISHIRWGLFTIYIHRGLCHGSIEFSKPLCTFIRWWLWTCGWYWPGWRKNFFLLHNYHHITSDHENDPHDPRKFTLRELTHVYDVKPGMAFYYPPEFEAKYPHIQDFDDKMERFFLKYPKSGQWQLHIVCLILFGPIAFLIGSPLWYVWQRYGTAFNGFFMTHGIGTCKWIDYKSPYATEEMNRRAVNYFPIGIYQAGEEYHSNHHSRPGSAKFAHRWWEIDMGYVYALMFEKLGLLKIKKR